MYERVYVYTRLGNVYIERISEASWTQIQLEWDFYAQVYT